jgi:Cu+-exporting ATPase
MIRNGVSLVALAALLCLVSVAACGGNQAPPAASPSHESTTAPASKGAVKEAGDAKVGDTAKCPVSGEEFTVEATSPKTEHDGKTYYFCCAGCKKKFEADPAKFAKKS